MIDRYLVLPSSINNGDQKPIPSIHSYDLHSYIPIEVTRMVQPMYFLSFVQLAPKSFSLKLMKIELTASI